MNNGCTPLIYENVYFAWINLLKIPALWDGNVYKTKNRILLLSQESNPTKLFWGVLTILQDATGGLSNANVEVKDGYIFCSFTREALTEIVAPTHTVTIDLVLYARQILHHF